MPFKAPDWAVKYPNPDSIFWRSHRNAHGGYWWIELGGTRDVIADNEELRFELLRIVLGVWDWIKNSGQRPNSAKWALETVGMIPGKRESRRLTGDDVQTQRDLMGGWRERDDGGAYYILLLTARMQKDDIVIELKESLPSALIGTGGSPLHGGWSSSSGSPSVYW